MTTVLWWGAALILSPILIQLLADAIPGGHILIPALVVLAALRLLLALFLGGRERDTHGAGITARQRRCLDLLIGR